MTTIPPRPDKPQLPEGVPEIYTITCKSRHVSLGMFYSWDDAIAACKQAHEMLGCMFKPVPFIIVHGAKLMDVEEPRTSKSRDYGDVYSDGMMEDDGYKGGQYL